MVESSDDGLVHHVVELFEVVCFPVPAALDRDQHDVVVPMPVRVVALSEDSLIGLRRKPIGVQPMGGAKPIAPGHADPGHRLPLPPQRMKSQDRSFVEQSWLPHTLIVGACTASP
jgi:hypothetical protein